MVSIIDGNFSNNTTRIGVSLLNGVTTLGYRTLGEGIFYFEIKCENDSTYKQIGVSSNFNQGWVAYGQFNNAIYPIKGQKAGSIYGIILDLSGNIGKMSWNLNGGDFSDWIELKDYYGNIINSFRIAIVGSSSNEGEKYFEVIYNKDSFITDLRKVSEKVNYHKIYSFDGSWSYINKILILSNDNKTYSLERINTWHETKMTSNTTPAPFIASASSMWTAVSPLPPYKAFNGTNIDSYDCWVTADGQVKGWIQIDFGEKKRVNMLSLTSRNDSDQSIHAVSGFPKDIIIHGSNDGINFEQIKSFDSLSVTTYNETITLKLPTSYYRIYRLEILSNNGNTRFTAIGEISYVLKEDKVINIPSYSEQNFINYGMDSPIQFNGFFTNKNYILQDGVSKNENGYWTTKLDRKPLSIKFE